MVWIEIAIKDFETQSVAENMGLGNGLANVVKGIADGIVNGGSCGQWTYLRAVH